MHPYIAQAFVNAAPERVWPLVADVLRWPAWLPTMTSVEPLNEGPLAVGARYRLVQPGFRPTVWSVVVLTPGRVLAWEALWPGARALASHTVNARPDGSSEVVLQVEFSGPMAWLAKALAGRRIQQYLKLERVMNFPLQPAPGRQRAT